MDTEKRAALVAEFINAYNKKWSEEWQVRSLPEVDNVEVFRPGSASTDGHFVKALSDFAKEKDLAMCVIAFYDTLYFCF